MARCLLTVRCKHCPDWEATGTPEYALACQEIHIRDVHPELRKFTRVKAKQEKFKISPGFRPSNSAAGIASPARPTPLPSGRGAAAGGRRRPERGDAARLDTGAEAVTAAAGLGDDVPAASREGGGAPQHPPTAPSPPAVPVEQGDHHSDDS